jgi:hypothetical protein
MKKMKIYCKYILLDGTQTNQMKFDFLSTESLIMINNTAHRIQYEIENDFVTFYIEYGTPKPLPDHVINVEKNRDEDNPRSLNQIEPKQMFALIDIANSQIWTSSIKKEGVIVSIFNRMGLKCELKNIYNTDEFVDKLKSVNGIKVTSTPESLFKLSKLNEVLDYDVYGYGASSAILELKYKKSKLLSGDIQKNISELFQQRSSFESFIISGINDGDMNVVFNNESLVQKIYLDIEEKETGDFDQIEVINEMKAKVRCLV